MAMSLQAIFNRVRNHLMTQGKKAEDRGSCYYAQRFPDGSILQCAVGCLLPPEVGENLAGTVRTGRVLLALERNGVLGNDDQLDEARISLLGHLQTVHDVHEVSSWPEQLEKLRIKFNLAEDE